MCGKEYIVDADSRVATTSKFDSTKQVKVQLVWVSEILALVHPLQAARSSGTTPGCCTRSLTLLTHRRAVGTR